MPLSQRFGRNKVHSRSPAGHVKVVPMSGVLHFIETGMAGVQGNWRAAPQSGKYSGNMLLGGRIDGKDS